jgi:hypothetical protein
MTQVEGALDNAAKAMLRTGARATKAIDLTEPPSVEAIVQRIQEVESGKVAEQVAAQHSEQPEIAIAMNQRLLADAAYLKQRIPAQAPAPDAALRPAQKTGPVSPLAAKELAAVAQALHSPPSVFADIAAGKVDMVQVQALRDRRPLMFEDMKQRVLQQAATSTETIPFAQRNVIGLVFDFPADWSQDPANSAAIQAAVRQPPPDAAPGSTKPSQSANIPAKAAEAYALPLSPVNP